MFSKTLEFVENDDEFFSSLDKPTSTLSNIFGSQKASSDKEPSLKYAAPKEIKKDKLNAEPSISWSVQVARVVTAFKLMNQENTKIGKVGLAVLKNSNEDKKIIIYKTKMDILSTLTLEKNVNMHYKSSYLQFKDNVGSFWSIFFESNAEEFLDIIRDHIIYDNVIAVDHINSESSHQKEETIKSSISEEELITKDSEKSKILSRMAKMGKALPTLTSHITTDLSDSSDCEMISTSIPSKPTIIPRNPKLNQRIANANRPLTAVVPASSSIIQTEIVPYNLTMPSESQYMNMLLTENRTQNTEIRINISKLETKIEKVLDKMNSIKNSDCVKDKEDEILELEEKVLELKKENRNLRQSIIQLENKSQGSACNLDELKDYSKSFEMLGMQSAVKYEMNPLNLCREVLDKSKIVIDSLKYDLESQSISYTKLEGIKLMAEEHLKKSIENTLEDNESLKQRNLLLELEIEKLREEKKKVDEKKEQINDIVKQIMNKLYQNLCEKFEDTQNKTFSTAEVVHVCGIAIKQETKVAIGNHNEKN